MPSTSEYPGLIVRAVPSSSTSARKNTLNSLGSLMSNVASSGMRSFKALAVTACPVPTFSERNAHTAVRVRSVASDDRHLFDRIPETGAVAAPGAQRHLQQGGALPRVEAPGGTEVDEAEGAVVEQHDVARVRVRMEVAVREHVPRHRVHEAVGELDLVELELCDPLAVGDATPSNRSCTARGDATARRT